MSDAKSPSALTQAQQIRLESVALAYRHDRPPEDVIDRASKLAAFVAGAEPEAAAAPVKPGKAAKDKQVAPDSDLI
jgi:hypothetical protein